MSTKLHREYRVTCRRWVRNLHGENVWETVIFHPADEKQARSFYDGIREDLAKGRGTLEDPQIMTRTVTDWKPL